MSNPQFSGPAVRFIQRLLGRFGVRIARVSAPVDPVAPFDVLEAVLQAHGPGNYCEHGGGSLLSRRVSVEELGWTRTADAAADLVLVDEGAATAERIDDMFDAHIRPPIIHYEWSELSVERRCAVKQRLLDEGYRFLDVGGDTIALRSDT